MSQAVSLHTDRAPAKRDFPTQLDAYEPQIKAALPEHISVDRFKRVVLTAVNQTPDLLEADRATLFNSAVKCAADGLVPDGREAALVVFKTKKGNEWIKAVQYMPMVRGLVKLARQSGDISAVSAHIVYENDQFEYVLGDDERMTHTPTLDGNRGAPKLAYATVKFKDGTTQREILTMEDVKKIRAVSKSGNNDYGPWAQWFDEMAKKSALRRLLKYVSLSPDVQRVVDRDDETQFSEMKRAALRSIGGSDTAQAAALAAIGGTEDVVEAEAIDALPPADEEISQDTPFDWSRYVEMTVADFGKHKTRAALTKDWDDIKERLMNEDAPEDVRASLTEAYLNRTRELPAK